MPPSRAEGRLLDFPAPRAGILLSDLLHQYFERLPGAFRPEKAGKWSASIYFDLGDAGWTLTVERGSCRIEEGRAGEPSARVSGSREVWERVARGEDSIKNAFVRGDLATDHAAAILRFERAFDLGEDGAAIEVSSLRPDLVGRVLVEEPAVLDGAAMRAFARATGESAEAYFREADPEMPIVFPITLMRSIFVRLLTMEDTGGDVTRMVHAEQDIRIRRPLAPGDSAVARAEIASVEEVAYGESLSVEQRIAVGDEVAVEITSVLFFRDPSGKRRSLRNLHTRPHMGGRRGTVLFEAISTVGEDQPLLYAEASGDRNPLHTDREFAKSLGFRDVLLQGTCTMAIAGRALVEHAASGDPRRLGRLRVRFARPVFPGDTLTTSGWVDSTPPEGTVYGFETVNQEGKRVLINGVALVR